MNSYQRLPYPGLRAFTRDESDLFFGRENCVDSMVDRLAETRFLAVLGPSGSGKSSLVRTGLLDALDLGLLAAAGSRWKIADMHPGGQPLRKLAASLLQLQQGQPAENSEIDHLTEVLCQGPRSVVRWASSGNLPEGSNLLILVDQFEELFRYGDYAQREEAEAFVSSLLESSASAKASIYIVMTMRSEYLGACSSISGLAEHISAGLYLTPRMDREECRQAIVGPAGVVGFALEPALVNRLLNDLSSFAPWEASEDSDLAAQLARQADQLPLMQHVLNRLWLRAQLQGSGPAVELKLSEYEQIGGLSGALDAHGAEVIAGLGNERLRSIESVFRALVSGNSLASAVRRPCRIAELVEVAGGRREDVIAILEAFCAPGCNFLRATDASLANDAVIVDISHESLIRQWTPLRQWLEKEVRDGAAWRRLISAQERFEHQEGGLLTGLDYQSSAAWWNSANPTPIWAARHGGNFEPVRAFVQSSREAVEARTAAERRRQLRERRLLVTGIAGLAMILAIVSGLGLLAWRETGKARVAEAKSFAALQRLSESTDNLKTSNQKLEDAKHVSDETAQQRDKALHEALEQKALADAAKAGAEQDARRLTHALDDVSNIINSDRYGHLVGLGTIQHDLMTAIQKYQSDIEKQHRNMVGEGSIVRDDYHSALALGAIGDAFQERYALKKGYDDGLKAIDATPRGTQPSDALLADFLNDAYIYVWFLFDIGETQEAAQALQRIEGVITKYPPNPNSANLLIAFGRIESLESRSYADEKLGDLAAKHSKKAVDLGLAAMNQPDANMDTLTFAFREYLNLALDTTGPDEQSLREKGCKLADRMYSSQPLDQRSIIAHVDCVELDGDLAANKGDSDNAKKFYEMAEESADQGLRVDPKDQALLLRMAELENSLGYLVQGAGQESALYRHRMNAKNYFVRALDGRTEFQSDPTQLKRIYNSCKAVNFPDSTAELLFYKDIVGSLSQTLNAFPKAPSFAYIAADSSIHIGELVAKQPEQTATAETYLSQSIQWFDRSGVMLDTSRYTEDFYGYCGAYQQRAALYGDTHRLDLMVADISKMKGACTPVLEKYPWDIYLRGQFVDAEKNTGRVLFEAQRYKEALPYLEYASHWLSADSTKLLARMYRDGLGVDKNENKAKELEALADKQTVTRFTIPADFGGVKAPFYIYIRDWPADYPYEGIDDQVIWLKEARGGTFPPEVIDSLHKLVKLAHDNKVSFRELTEYAFAEAAKDKKDDKGTSAAKSEDNADNSAKKPEPPVSTNKEAQAKYEQAGALAVSGKWEQAAEAIEQALQNDPDSAGILQFAAYIYHEKLFRYDRAYELNARLVKLGSGNEDFVENNLSTSRFKSCSEMAVKVRERSSDKKTELVMTSLEFACLSGEKKQKAALAAGVELSKELPDLKKGGWTFSGTEHFVSTSPAFSPKGSDWVKLFEALEQGDQAKARVALTALGVPEEQSQK